MGHVLTAEEKNILIDTLKRRFEANKTRHKDITWDLVEVRLHGNAWKLWSLHEMERTGGEPDVVGYDAASDEILFVDCSKETPTGRRNTCYDDEALASRKKFKPDFSAMGMAKDMGIELLNEEQYRYLQTLGEFDTATSSWVLTPQSIRSLKGALFCDRRFNTVFVYHNGAESYYSVRGFRGWLRV